MKLAWWFVALLAGAAALGALFPAHAMHLSPSGIGQALIYPYYTALSKGGNVFNTYLSIVNRDFEGKALRVRFREGRNGREVAGFNLFLNPGDAWAGAVVPSPNGASVLTRDESCTSPAFAVPPGSLPTLEFSAGSYAGADGDAYGHDDDRLREGYVEVLEMARFNETSPNPATHCDDFRAERVAGAFGNPTGGLSGTLTLINLNDGMDFTVNADAIEDLATDKYYRPPGDPYPDFNAAEISRASAFVKDGKLYRSAWNSGVAALDATLLRGTVSNEFVLDTATASATDWIVTLPTKRFHAVIGPGDPFFDAFVEGRDVTLGMHVAPRDGPGLAYTQACGFLCPPATREVDMRLRWAASVLGFRRDAALPAPGISDALASRNAWIVTVPPEWENGSARLGFGGFSGFPSTRFNAANTTRIDTGSAGSETFRIQGLPALGFMVRTFRNGTLTCTGASCQGNYGGSFPHKYSRDLEP